MAFLFYDFYSLMPNSYSWIFIQTQQDYMLESLYELWVGIEMHTSKSGCRQAPLPGIKPGNNKWESAGSKFDRSTFLITPTGYWVAVPWFRRLTTDLSHRRPGFRPESVHVRFVVGKVSLVQISLQDLMISPVSIILPGTHIMWGIHNRPVGGRRSET
jgi:hypothetical protein